MCSRCALFLHSLASHIQLTDTDIWRRWRLANDLLKFYFHSMSTCLFAHPSSSPANQKLCAEKKQQNFATELIWFCIFRCIRTEIRSNLWWFSLKIILFVWRRYLSWGCPGKMDSSVCMTQLVLSRVSIRKLSLRNRDDCDCGRARVCMYYSALAHLIAEKSRVKVYAHLKQPRWQHTYAHFAVRAEH